MALNNDHWDVCLQYLFQSAGPGSWTLQDDGQGAYIKTWNLADPQPSEADLEAVETPALAWAADKETTELSEYEQWPMQLKAVIKLTVKEINILRVAAGLPARTPAQVKAALKQEM